MEYPDHKETFLDIFLLTIFAKLKMVKNFANVYTVSWLKKKAKLQADKSFCQN